MSVAAAPVNGMGRRGWLRAAMAFAFAGLAGCATPGRPPGIVGEAQGSGTTTLAAQLQALRDDPAPPDARRVIFVGIAANSREDVFDRDVRAFDATLRERLGPAYRAVLLSNIRLAQGPRALPLATVENIDTVFTALQQQRRAQDRYVVLITTHGAPGLLEVEQAALQAPSLAVGSTHVAQWMQRLAPRPTWLVISACYSGSHLPALQAQPHLLTMAAAAADRPSFGCHNSESNTWFVHEMLDALKHPATRTLRDVWQATTQGVARREAAGKARPSQPQWQAGDAVLPAVDAPLSSL